MSDQTLTWSERRDARAANEKARFERMDRQGLIKRADGMDPQLVAYDRIARSDMGDASNAMAASMLALVRETLRRAEAQGIVKPLQDWTDWEIIDFARQRPPAS